MEYAEPDFVTLGHHSPRPPENDEKETAGDSAADQEYALRITEAVEAWKRQAGLADVTVAILDEGVQTEHGNLGPAISHTYDATRDETAQDPEPADAHGTACAGVAAAVPNQRSDLRGIASGCSIMAVRIGYTDAKSGKYVTKQWWAKRGIDWAWRNGAAVLSNSWGGTTESTGITRALERARVQGRAGKGCVVVVAAGNEDGPVDFPGTLPDVLTVSASNQYDEPKTTESADRERWWGSSFGPEVDVAAPGVDIYSTDNLAAAGYTPQRVRPTSRSPAPIANRISVAAGMRDTMRCTSSAWLRSPWRTAFALLKRQ